MVLKLAVLDITKSWGYKYSYSFKLKEDIKNNEEQMRKIRKEGQKKNLKYKGMDEDKESFDFYIFFQAEKYYWLFENKTTRRFKGTFSFSLKNLAIEVDEEEKELKEKQDSEGNKGKEKKKKAKDQKNKKTKKNKAKAQEEDKEGK